MGIVHLAHQEALGRDVALKQVALARADKKAVERFIAESRLAASLNDPHIVAVYDRFEQDGIAYIAMEYLPDGSLEPRVHSVTAPQAFGILEDVLAGLAHAHESHIVHRDLKPANLLVAPNGRIKITDFGIAKLLDAGREAHATRRMLGTPAYMAPEQALGGRVGPAADLYAVGALAWDLFLRRPLAEAGEPMAGLLKRLRAPVPDPRAVDPDLDPELAAWIQRLLETDPDDRYGSAPDAWNALEPAVIRLHGPLWRRESRLPTQRRTPTPAPTQAPQPVPRRRIRLLRAAWLRVLTPLVAGAIAVPVALSQEAERPPAAIARVVARIPISSSGGDLPQVAFGRGGTWVINPGDGSVSRIDAATNRIAATVPVNGRDLTGIAVGRHVWLVSRDDGTLESVDPVTGTVTGRPIRVGGGPSSVDVDDSKIYVAGFDAGTLIRVRMADGKRIGPPIRVGSHPNSIDVVDGVLWVANYSDGTVSRIDARSGRRLGADIRVAEGPSDVQAGFGSIWVPSFRAGTVSRIDASTGRVLATIPVAPEAMCVTATARAVWVTAGAHLYRIDPATNRVSGRPLALARKGGGCVRATAADLWATVEGVDEVLRLRPS